MIRSILAASLLALSASIASAEIVSRSYIYFSVSGTTLKHLDEELQRRGPQVKTTGQRHPGATHMWFETRLGHAVVEGRCRVADVKVTVVAKVTLPRWTQRSRADHDTRLAWDALANHIERHENEHVEIARDYALQIERKLLRLDAQTDCNAATAQARLAVDRILALHERAQVKFDKVAQQSLELRLLRLTRQRAKVIH